MTLQELINEVQFELDDAPEFTGVADDTWDEWFVRNSERFRRLIGELIMRCETGTYFVVDQRRTLALLGVTVTVKDGLRGLLSEWLRQAREKLAELQAVPA